MEAALPFGPLPSEPRTSRRGSCRWDAREEAVEALGVAPVPWRGLGRRMGTARGRGRREGLGGPGRASRAPRSVGSSAPGAGASHVCSPRSRVEGLARRPRRLDSSPAPAPQGVLAARRPLAGPLLGGTRSPSVSSRCTNQYSVMTGLERGPSSRSVPRFRDPSSPCVEKDPCEPWSWRDLLRSAPRCPSRRGEERRHVDAKRWP